MPPKGATVLGHTSTALNIDITAGDTIIGGGTMAKIAKIIIGGLVQGTAGGGDQFGFVSHSIGAFGAGGFVIPVPAAPGSLALSPATGGDVTLRTIS